MSSTWIAAAVIIGIVASLRRRKASLNPDGDRMNESEKVPLIRDSGPTECNDDAMMSRD